MSSGGCLLRFPCVGKHLEILTIEKPCTASWDAMRGDDKVRHCLKCHLDVYDLSAMSEAEAEHLVATREGHMCFRFTRRADGTLITQDCEPLRGEARPCTPRPSAVRPPAPRPAPFGMGLEPPKPPEPSVTGPPPMPLMGMPPPPPPMSAMYEDGLARDVLLNEITRAVHAHADVDRAEELVRAIEKAVVAKDPAGSNASCPRCKGALWIHSKAEALATEPPERTPPEIEAAKALYDEVAPAVQASFDAARAAKLLRELTRLDFGTGAEGSRSSCPHCHAWLATPLEGVRPIAPPPPRK